MSTSFQAKINSRVDSNTAHNAALKNSYETGGDIPGALGYGLTTLTDSVTTIQDISSVYVKINEYDQEVGDGTSTNVQNGNYFSASTLQYNSFNEALTAIFVALLVCLVVLLILATGIIDITITVVLIVISLTISIIYAGGVLIMGANQSSTLPGIFNWDFTFKDE